MSPKERAHQVSQSKSCSLMALQNPKDRENPKRPQLRKDKRLKRRLRFDSLTKDTGWPLPTFRGTPAPNPTSTPGGKTKPSPTRGAQSSSLSDPL